MGNIDSAVYQKRMEDKVKHYDNVVNNPGLLPVQVARKNRLKYAAEAARAKVLTEAFPTHERKMVVLNGPDYQGTPRAWTYDEKSSTMREL